MIHFLCRVTSHSCTELQASCVARAAAAEVAKKKAKLRLLICN